MFRFELKQRCQPHRALGHLIRSSRLANKFRDLFMVGTQCEQERCGKEV